MQDTSFAIHPGMKKDKENNTYYDIGDLQDIKKENSSYQLTCQNGYVELLFYRDDILRIVMNPKAKPVLKSTPAIILKPNTIHSEMLDDKDKVVIKNSLLKVQINKRPLRITITDVNNRILVQEKKLGMGYYDKYEVVCFKDMERDDHFYGFGEKTSFLDKQGEKMTMWNSDVYAPHNPEIDSLYQSIPYFMTLKNGKAHGLYFDNSFKTIFDMKSNKELYSFFAEGGQLDYYIMAGPTPKDVLEQYTALTGRMPIPPKWAVGYHQSRYSYQSEQEVREVVKTFKEKEIPLDAIYLDIHYMDGYRVFTFDNERYPNPETMVKELKAEGIHIVPIVDPGVKEDPEYPIFKEGILQDRFCKYLDGKVYYGDVWPGNSAFPDFLNTDVRKWWGETHRYYTDLGIDGIWNDMNEPAVFNEEKTMDEKVTHNRDGELLTHRQMHNLYGLMMGEATYTGLKKLLDGNRPFVLTRAGFSGVQRYATVWTGDNRSFWEHLAMSIPMCLNLGISGVGLTGPDVGGFAYDTNGELLTRWTQVGAFYPYFRNHSALDTVRQEPWALGEQYEEIIKKYIRLRYKWLPHLYSLFAVTSRSGLPVMRPLFMEYPNDKHTYQLSDQFMIGDNVIIAPIIQPGVNHRAVYLPEGDWYDYWTDEVYHGGHHFLVKAELDVLPIFIKAGSVIAHGPIKLSTSVSDHEISIHLYPKKQGEYVYELYEDDGKTFAYETGEYLLKKFTFIFNKDNINVVMENIHDHYKPSWHHISLIVHDENKDMELTINGEIHDLKRETNINIASTTIDL